MNKKENVRRTEIKNLVLMISITLIIGISTLIFYITRDKTQYINYHENSDVDYKVYLKENEFYKENYLDKNKGYIASLIESVSAKFQYELSFNKDIDYKYSYRIAAEVDVQDEKSDNNIYHFSEDIVKGNIAKNTGDLEINEDLNVNYGEYNNLISRFKDVYELRNIVSTLNICLYVNVQDIDKSNSSVLKDKKVSSLTIPLTENTVSIDISNDRITDKNSKMELSIPTNYHWTLVISIFYLIISIIYIVYLIIYSMRTRTAQMIYDKEIKSIINNYDSYIQKITDAYDIGTSQVLKIESFNDMLEIRDTLKQPILMLENEEKDGTFFIIPATNNIIYTYALRVIDIKAKMDGKEIPTYDITEISHEDFMKKKKYTDKYIKEQITMTTSMPKIDEQNIIKGNKDKKTALYDQLEKTSSYSLSEIRKAKKKLEQEENKKTTTKKETPKKVEKVAEKKEVEKKKDEQKKVIDKEKEEAAKAKKIQQEKKKELAKKKAKKKQKKEKEAKKKK